MVEENRNSSKPKATALDLQGALADPTRPYDPNEEVVLAKDDIEQIRQALAELKAEFERGEGLSSDEARKQLGLL